MFAKGATLIQWLEEWVPKSIAVPDDRIGLQLGTLQKEIKNVMITLEVTDAVIDEAIARSVDLIIAHHAIMFRPLKHLQTDTPAGHKYEKLIKHDIAVYISHTNLDIAEGGVNDMMAQALGLQKTRVLAKTGEEELQKLVVFIPKAQEEEVRSAIMRAGAGWIGSYSHCSFNLEGTGTFLPESGTQPFIGEQGKLESVAEVRMETIVPVAIRNQVLAALKKAHPYEEPAYDLYPLKLEGKPLGLGRVGELSETMTLRALNDQVKTAFGLSMSRVVGELDTPVKKVAVLGGMGARYLSSALFAGADVYITGDIDYHTAQDALEAGMTLIDPGHHAEEIMKAPVAAYLEKRLAASKFSSTNVLVSETKTDPFQFV
ncbi:Nif3-like dinuclear metal center hexameric protein [Marinicrinis sediminis]|uniref:GTP cyclohydrolase 1 type 2 homolog n=1 Tax=Marinicrinis sediminis TaxID=1652465 RepID=A0ABW5RBD4_9BACL